MNNFEYLNKVKKFNKKILNVNTQCRIAKALEIIAEEFCIINKPQVEIKIPKIPKIIIENMKKTQKEYIDGK